MHDSLDFDSMEPIKVPVRYRGAQYVLREATEDGACKYRNAVTACRKYGQDGALVALENLSDCEPLLVSFCLFEVKEDGTERPVPVSNVRLFPSKIIDKLYERAKEISEIDPPATAKWLEEQISKLTERLTALKGPPSEKREDPAKNERSATATGSP